MREIGLGKELGDSPHTNVVQFIGCVTTQSKKPVLYILSCLLFEICTYSSLFFFVFVVCFGKINSSIVLKNVFGKQYDKKLFWQLSILCISQNVLTAMSMLNMLSMLNGLDNNQESEVSQKFIGNLISRS